MPPVVPHGAGLHLQEQIMTTSKRVASAAGKTLRDPKSTKTEREEAASDLAQAARHKDGKKK